MARRITIKQLHAKTGEQVRLAAASRTPVVVTDQGEPVAVLANPALLKKQRRKRVLLADFVRLMERTPSADVADDLDAVRGDR